MKNVFSLSKAVSAGIAGTIAMTIFMFMGKFMGINMNVPKMLSSMFGGSLAIGWAMHFMIGIFLAFSFGLIFYNLIGINNKIVKGMLFGIIPWFMAQMIVMPMMSVLQGMNFSDGLFSGSFKLAFASLIAHFVYGAVVGAIYKPQLKTAVSPSV